MKKLFFAITTAMYLVFGAATSVAAEETSSDNNPISYSLSTTVWSEYLGSNGAVFQADPVAQTSFTASRGDCYANVWWSTGFDDNFSGDFGDEIDWTIGCAKAYEGTTFDVSVAFFDTFDLFSSDGPVGDIINPGVVASRTLATTSSHTLSGYASVEVYLPFRGEIDSGVNVEVGAAHTWEIATNISLNHSFALMYDSGAFGFDKGFVGHYNPGINWFLSERVTLTLPQAKLSFPITTDAEIDGRNTKAVFGGTLAIQF